MSQYTITLPSPGASAGGALQAFQTAWHFSPPLPASIYSYFTDGSAPRWVSIPVGTVAGAAGPPPLPQFANAVRPKLRGTHTP